MLTSVAGFQQEHLYRTCHCGGASIYVEGSIKYKSRPDVPRDGVETICIEVESLQASPSLFLLGIDSVVALFLL